MFYWFCARTSKVLPSLAPEARATCSHSQCFLPCLLQLAIYTYVLTPEKRKGRPTCQGLLGEQQRAQKKRLKDRELAEQEARSKLKAMVLSHAVLNIISHQIRSSNLPGLQTKVSPSYLYLSHSKSPLAYLAMAQR